VKTDVAIVGAGLAGLAAARQLSIFGFETVVFESDSRVGGRVQTDKHESGALLDRGFQLYNPAYPESARVLDHTALDLRPFSSAVISNTPHGNVKLADPRKIPRWTIDSALPASGSITAKLAFVKYALKQLRRSAGSIAVQPDQATHAALNGAGVKGAFFEEVIRPFLAGVFLESELDTSARFLDLVLKSFLQGTPSVPALGMQAIPDQLAAALPPGTIHLNTPVSAITADSVTANGSTWHARAVIVATDSTAANLLTGVPVRTWNAVTTWYHLAPLTQLTEGKPVLIVNGGGAGPLKSDSIVNSVVITNAAPEYAPGHSLIATSALGVHPRDTSLTPVLNNMYGVPTNEWNLIGHYQIPHALPSMATPFNVSSPTRYADLFLAGDYRATSSIQGAMVSGRRAADSVMRSFLDLPDSDTPFEGRVHVST